MTEAYLVVTHRVVGIYPDLSTATEVARSLIDEDDPPQVAVLGPLAVAFTRPEKTSGEEA